MGKKLSELDEDTTLTDTDILHIRGLDGVDKRITAANLKEAMPQLHLLDEADRSADWDINVNPTTAWVEYDLSARVPAGTTALFGFALHTNADAYGALEIRDATPGTETDDERVRFSQAGADANTLIAGPAIIKATNGIFDIQEVSATNELTNWIFNLWGWFS